MANKDEILYTITLNQEKLAAIIDYLRVMNLMHDYAAIVIEKNRISSGSMDPSHISLCYWAITATTRKIAENERKILGFDTEELYKSLQHYRNRGNTIYLHVTQNIREKTHIEIEVTATKSRRGSRIVLETADEKHYSLYQQNGEKYDLRETIKNIEIKFGDRFSRVTLDAVETYNALKEISFKEDIVMIIFISDYGVCMNGVDETVFTTIKREFIIDWNVKENVSNLYPVERLLDVLKILKGKKKKLDWSIELSLANSLPLLLKIINTDEDRGEFGFILAPRVEDTNYDDFTDEDDDFD